MLFSVLFVVTIILGSLIAWGCFAEREEGYGKLTLGAMTVVGLGLFVGFGTNGVSAGHVGLVREFGALVGQLPEGVHFVAPWKEVEDVSVQIVSHKFDDLSSFSRESQDVYVSATLNTQVAPDKIQKLYREVGPNYFEVLIKPRVNQAFKDETVRYSSVEIAPNRETIRKAVRAKLEEELSAHSITVQDLLIDEIRFSKVFQDAIEEKQRQTQIALAEQEKVKAEKSKAEQAVEAAKGKADSVLIAAKKQAEANRVLAESLTPAYINYLYVEKLSPRVEVMMVPTGQPFLLDLDNLSKQPQTTPVTQ